MELAVPSAGKETHSGASSHSRPSSSSSRPPPSPRNESAILLTPDRERNFDPLSAHILARTQPDTATESPSLARNISELVISKFKEDDPPSNASPDTDARRKRVSFFAKLRGKDHEEEYLETPDDIERTEGTHACIFAGKHTERPAYIRVRSRNRTRREFNNLFLAQEMHTGTGEASAVWSMKFSHDGQYLATGGQDMIVRVWKVIASPGDRSTAGCASVFLSEPYRVFQGHTSDVLELSWSKGNFLISSSMDKTVRLWHVTREECLCCFQHSDFVTSIAFHPKDDHYFLSGSLDCKLRLWNIAEKKVAYWNELPELITAVAFDPIGRLAIAGSSTGLCLFYDTEGLRYHTQIHVRSSRGKNARGSKITGIQAVSLNPDNPHSHTKLLITSNDSRIRLYSLRDKSLMVKLKGNSNASSQIRASFNDDCKYVICGSEDKQVYIWNTKDGLEAGKSRCGYEHFAAHTDVVSATCFAPSRTKALLMGANDPIYDIKSDKSSVSTAQDSSDGNIVICADYTGHIKVFRQDSSVPRPDDPAAAPKKLVKKSSIKSMAPSTISQDSVKRLPHEPVAPISPARRKPAIQVNGHAVRPDTVHEHEKHHHKHEHTHPKEHGHHHSKSRSMKIDASTIDPYLNEYGESLEFYNTSARPRQPRADSTASWFTGSLAKSETGLKCTRCGSQSFGAMRKRDSGGGNSSASPSYELRCTNCHLPANT